MNNKILLQLIKKDIEELSFLVDTIKDEAKLSQALVDITLAKANTLIAEIQLIKTENFFENEITKKKEELADNHDEGRSIVKMIQEPALEQSPVQVVRLEEELGSEPKKEISEKENAETSDTIDVVLPGISSEKNKAYEDAENIEKKSVETEPVLINNTRDQKELKKDTGEKADGLKINDTVVVPENELPKEHEKRILGEKYSKEPSLNDRLALNKKQETKVKARPVTSLKTAIGLNDRFLYIRELFANDGNIFEKTIHELDQSDSLSNAIGYLDQNFQWQKTETSVKFIELIKRRFNN